MKGYFIPESEKPNRDKYKPNLAFKSDLDSEIMKHLDSMGQLGLKSSFINRAIRFYYRYQNYRKAFMIDIIQENYELAKYLLRRIGSSIKSAATNK